MQLHKVLLKYTISSSEISCRAISYDSDLTIVADMEFLAEIFFICNYVRNFEHDLL